MASQRDEIDEFYEKNYKDPEGSSSFPEESPEIGYGYYKGSENADKKQMKLDFQSPMELLLSAVAAIAALAAVGVLGYSSNARITDAVLIKLVSIPAVIFVVSIALRFLLNDYYLLDNEQKRILLCRRFLGTEKTKPYADFDDVCFATTLGSYFPSKGRTGERAWSYTPVLVMKNKKIFDFAAKDCYSYYDVNSSAKQVARFIGIPYKPGRNSGYAKIVFNKENGLPDMIPETNQENFMRVKFKWYLLGGVIVAIIVVFLFFSNMRSM